MIRVDIPKPDAVFNPIYIPQLRNKKRIQIYFGGSSSGKSFFLAQRSVIDVLSGRNYLVVRAVARTLRSSCWNEIVKAINRMGLVEQFNIGKSEMTITCKVNGCQFLFAGLNDVERVKSITSAEGVITDIWIEEATETERQDFKQLEKRLRGFSKHTKRLILSFNPIYKEHWIFKEFFGSWVDGKTWYEDEGMSILKTTYRDNKFLPEEDRKALENETDPYYKDVYSDGNWGVLGDVIFKNWRVEDLSELKKTADKSLYGLDFGFSTDPAAGVKLVYQKAKKQIYILDELYERGLTNSQLAQILLPWCNGLPIVCDSAEPKSIKELQNYHIRAMSAKKGPDSLGHGIQWLQGHEIIVDVECQNMKNELQLYQWRKDRDGNSMRVPEDRDNHLIDALRYALEHESTSRFATTMNLRGL